MKKFFKNHPGILSIALLACIGILYYIWLQTTNIGIPCQIRSLTGFYCPSCGISRMFLALFRLDLKAAFRYNAAVMILVPCCILFALIYKVKGSPFYHSKKSLNIFIAVILILYITFGILRNVPGFEFLCPPEELYYT